MEIGLFEIDHQPVLENQALDANLLESFELRRNFACRIRLEIGKGSLLFDVVLRDFSLLQGLIGGENSRSPIFFRLGISGNRDKASVIVPDLTKDLVNLCKGQILGNRAIDIALLLGGLIHPITGEVVDDRQRDFTRIFAFHGLNPGIEFGQNLALGSGQLVLGEAVEQRLAQSGLDHCQGVTPFVLAGLGRNGAIADTFHQISRGVEHLGEGNVLFFLKALQAIVKNHTANYTRQLPSLPSQRINLGRTGSEGLDGNIGLAEFRFIVVKNLGATSFKLSKGPTPRRLTPGSQRRKCFLNDLSGKTLIDISDQHQSHVLRSIPAIVHGSQSLTTSSFQNLLLTDDHALSKSGTTERKLHRCHLGAVGCRVARPFLGEDDATLLVHLGLSQ